jgi:D-alanyl-D-alanine dipeptidase
MSAHGSTEALIDVAASAPLRVRPGRPALLRFGVVERLVVAQSLLPRDIQLVIVAGHDAGSGSHATGGAVDLTLAGADDDAPAGLPCCRCDPVTPPPADRLRMLAGALAVAGLVNDVQRWWHWSYGDPSWAGVTGAAQARYGPVPRSR